MRNQPPDPAGEAIPAWRLCVLHRLALELLAERNRDALADGIVRAFQELNGADSASMVIGMETPPGPDADPASPEPLFPTHSGSLGRPSILPSALRRSICQSVLQTGGPILVGDVPPAGDRATGAGIADCRLQIADLGPGATGGPGEGASPVPDTQSPGPTVLAVPLRAAPDAPSPHPPVAPSPADAPSTSDPVLGVLLAVHDRPRLITPADVQLAEMLAAYAALALENLRYFDEHVQMARLDGAIKTARAAAHELNQPLTALAGYAKLLQRTGDDAAHGAYAQQIVVAAFRLGQRLRQFQRIVRFEEYHGYSSFPPMLDLDRSSE
ncbi:MAG: GAF domain-containing protein [Chloroflexi bacterium]|nr:GAF domain-containing protein [Chloroflexota bacterium]